MGSSPGWFRALWRALLSREARELVGSDHLGNKYYYVPSYKNWRGQTIREKRIVEAANKKEVDYEVGSIPTEWEAWIRKTRKTPPTMEEILRNENYREEMKVKSKDFYEKGKLSQEMGEELLPPPAAARVTGHASAPSFGKKEPAVAPTSTGKMFQPGSWMPQDGKTQNK
uniref:NADH dehydrogenase [ubiquinone] 1 alpha subcomplex assembly factor 2 n=1 Tax=Jaculus jaculus TaxID=51337 RepID=UPI001E1B20CB|nr:NADH dehydrogenase [ubiquinone] 1 alpha subcomplex assembly factor 2 [Jaculus jaculus]